jgi:3-oxoacyl-[acyl-carrier protein] reductase
VTGASRGIGRATAIRLAYDFSTVVIVARSAEALQDTASNICPNGAEPLALNLDLRESASAEVVVRQTLDRYGRIDAPVNIAGAVHRPTCARRVTIQAWEALKSARGLLSGTRCASLSRAQGCRGSTGTSLG